MRSQKKTPYEPYAARTSEEMNLALSNIGAHICVAFGPVEIDDEAFDAFVQRWIDLLAKASRGALQHPSRLPL